MEWNLLLDAWEVLPKTFVFLLLALFFLLSFTYQNHIPNLPPGPRGIPLLGYFPFISKTEPHLQLEKLRKQYGNIFGMYLGRTYTLFLCDIQSTKEAFNMDEFSGRPEGTFEFSKNVAHFASLSGQPWKDQRKVAVKSLRRMGIGSEELQDLTRSQVDIALKRLEEEASTSKDGQVNLRDAIEGATTGVVFKTVCGKTFPPDHTVYRIVHNYMKFFAENGTAISLDTCFPWLKPILSRIIMSKKEIKKIFSDMENCIWSEIDSHEQNKPEEAVDFIDFMIRERNKPGGKKKITRSEMNGNAQIMLFGGADTVRGTVEWFTLCMAGYPDVQQRIFEEINDFLGPTGKASYDDRDSMPYTQAALLESMRFRTIVPLNPVHSALVDTKFHGYNIPKDTVVISSIWSIFKDPKNWSHPEEFYPGHFLTEDETAVIVPEAFIPFSAGKRYCVGDKIALVESFIFGVSLLQRFKVLPPEGGVNLQGNLRLNMEPSCPVVKLLPRYY